MGWLSLCVLSAVILRLVAQLMLEGLNRMEVRRNAPRCPDALAGVMDAATYSKSVRYTLEKGRLGSVEAVYDAAVLLVLLFSGALPWWWARVDGLAPGTAWSGALAIVVTLILIGLLGLPLEWWSRFRLEEKFGFNKSTPGLWAVDQGKIVMLGLGIGFPIAWAVLALVGWAGPSWWVWAFALLFAFQVLMLVLHPKIILPLFNKLSPLPDGDQRTRLLALAERTGFRATTIETMDGSKRSGHSNAFFTGFGRFRRIVLFDTLMAQLAPDELEAVLAHEIGHYKRGHIPKFMAMMALLQFGMFAVVAWLARTPWFNAAFGMPKGMIAPTFLLVGLLSGVASFWFAPAGNWLSRRNEFEADAFARDAVGSSAPMIGALRKLSQENLSNLTPHPFYSMVFYSHPALVERERALRDQPKAGPVGGVRGTPAG
jgi:STE24 endopeptidase